MNFYVFKNNFNEKKELTIKNKIHLSSIKSNRWNVYETEL